MIESAKKNGTRFAPIRCLLAVGGEQFSEVYQRFGIAGLMLGFGLFWTVLGGVITPSMKAYNWLLLAFVYLPSLYLMATCSADFIRELKKPRALWLLLAIFLWALVSVSWSKGFEHPVTEVKREIFFVLLVAGWVVWGRLFPRPLRVLLVTCTGLAGVYSLVALCVPMPNLFEGRLYGLGGFMDNPNPAAYAISSLMVLSCTFLPRSAAARVIWFALQLCSLVFVIKTQSRGALLGLGITALVGALISDSRNFKLLSVVSLLIAVAVFCLEPSMASRGDANRFTLAKQAVETVLQHPWIGIGIGGDYELNASGDALHSHNLLLETAIQYGVIVTALWLVFWIWIGLRLWGVRHQPLGMAILLLWVFACVAQQFDVFMLFGRSRGLWAVLWVPILVALTFRSHSSEEEVDACALPGKVL